MTSPLPPRLRDTKTINDRVRQDRANLKQLYPGFVGGRFAPARRLGANQQLGDIEDDSEGDEEAAALAFCNTDATTAVTSGRINLHLTYVPVDGSLHLYWNGVALPPTEYLLNGQTVTFADHLIHVDDTLYAAYAYYPADIPEPEPLELVGTTTANYADANIAIPGGTVPGDLLILGLNSLGSPSFSDARLTAAYQGSRSGVYEEIWIGTADGSGSPIPITLGTFVGTQGFAVLTVLRNASAGTPVIKHGLAADYPYNLPAATAHDAVAFTFASYVTVNGVTSVDSTSDWGQLAQAGTGWDITANFWSDTTAGPTPPGSFTYSGLTGDYTAIAIPLENA